MNASDLHAIVGRLGGDLYAGGTRASVPAPGHSKRDRSLSLMQVGDRVVWHCFTPCEPQEVFNYLGLVRGVGAEAWERREAARQRDNERRAVEDRARRFCEALWRGTRPLGGSPAEIYLRQARRLSYMPGADVRFHPDAPRSYGAWAGLPSMLALVRDRAGSPCGLHVTALRSDGSGKALGNRSRVMFGTVAAAAVRLTPLRGDTLAVSEGLETGLAFAELHQTPTWAALSTSGLRAFAVPSGVRRLIVAADSDAAGLAAARELAERASARCDVTVTHPDRGDFNDLLRERRAHA
jgi:hypothetical protein